MGFLTSAPHLPRISGAFLVLALRPQVAARRAILLAAFFSISPLLLFLFLVQVAVGGPAWMVHGALLLLPRAASHGGEGPSWLGSLSPIVPLTCHQGGCGALFHLKLWTRSSPPSRSTTSTVVTFCKTPACLTRRPVPWLLPWRTVSRRQTSARPSALVV